MSVTVLNTDAQINATTLLNAESAQNVSGNKSFLRAPNAPFTVQSGSAKVDNLDSDKVDGKDSTDLILTDGTQAMTGTLNLGTPGKIQFPATQSASAGANVLDDYEEGTWTPVIGGNGGTSGQTYSQQTGTYTKIGQLVIAQFVVILSNKGTITSGVEIQGLPFTSNSTGQSFSDIYWENLSTTWVKVGGLISPSTTFATIRGATAAAANSATNLVTADIANTTQFVGCFMYRASA